MQHWAGVRLYTSYFYFAKSYVFNKQSLPPLRSYYLKLSLSRSYREILPSSFSIIHSLAFIYSINRPVLVFVRSIKNIFQKLRGYFKKYFLKSPCNLFIFYTSFLIKIKNLVIDFFAVRLSFLQNHVGIRLTFFSKVVYYSCWHN